MKAYIHPTSGATLRSYNRGELKEILKEIEEKNTTPGFKKISANLANAKMTIGSTSNSAAKKQPSYDTQGKPGSFVQVFVPEDVQAGDTLDLKVNSGKVVKVIVESVEDGGSQQATGSK